MRKLTFNNKHQAFYQSLKEAVNDYFRTNQIRKTGNWRLFHKTLVLVPLAVIIYISLLVFTLPAWVALVLCVSMGLTIPAIGFNVMHDACHGAYSSKRWVNETLGLTMNALGGNAFFWKQKHNILHHTYTNIEGLDDDIAQTKLLRQSPTQPHMAIHKYQHIYLPIAYGMTMFMWALYGDYRKYFCGRINNTSLQPMKRADHITFWISKVLYVFFYIVLPIMIVGFVNWLIGYFIINLITGLILAYVFQLAHAVEGPEFESAGVEDKMIETEWAVHQVKTTANFAPRNKILGWFVGGLNYQVEHHLFPRISHIHYPALSKIVREQCERFQLPYHSFPTLSMALASHVKTMKHLGQKTR